jgi:hypothetical protein
MTQLLPSSYRNYTRTFIAICLLENRWLYCAGGADDQRAIFFS